MLTQTYPNMRRLVQIIFVFGLGVSVLAASGCAPLKKKFIRQKKKDKETDARFTPVLDPVEYPDRHVSAEENYKYHYSLWKVWNKDLLQTIDSDGSDKRQKYLINQSVEQLEAMKELLSEESRGHFAAVIDDLKSVLGEYEKPESMRNKFSIRSKVGRYARTVRTDYAPGVIFQASRQP